MSTPPSPLRCKGKYDPVVRHVFACCTRPLAPKECVCIICHTCTSCCSPYWLESMASPPYVSVAAARIAAVLVHIWRTWLGKATHSSSLGDRHFAQTPLQLQPSALPSFEPLTNHKSVILKGNSYDDVFCWSSSGRYRLHDYTNRVKVGRNLRRQDRKVWEPLLDSEVIYPVSVQVADSSRDPAAFGGSLQSHIHSGLHHNHAHMIGRRSTTAMPTVLFVSENEENCKSARKMIRECGILAQHKGWKTAQASQDPSWGTRLEQLASGSRRNKDRRSTEHANYPTFQIEYQEVKRDPDFFFNSGTEILFDPSQPIQSRGQPLYIPHGSKLRIATANLIRIHEKAFYLMPAHVLFNKPGKLDSGPESLDDDFEIDSDDETYTIKANNEDDEDTYESLGFENTDNWSSSDQSSNFDTSSTENSDDEAYSQSSFGSFGVVESTHTSNPFGILDSAALQATRSRPRYPAPELQKPTRSCLAPFGILSRWSIDKDWALVEVIADSNTAISTFLDTQKDDLSTMPVASHSIAGAAVVTHTMSSGELTGLMSDTPFDTRLPGGTSFQEVFSVRLDGPLADGDCGSIIVDAITGALYGHIIAGCRETGFAFVMPASHIRLDFTSTTVMATPTFGSGTKSSRAVGNFYCWSSMFQPDVMLAPCMGPYGGGYPFCTLNRGEDPYKWHVTKPGGFLYTFLEAADIAEDDPWRNYSEDVSSTDQSWNLYDRLPTLRQTSTDWYCKNPCNDSSRTDRYRLPDLTAANSDRLQGMRETGLQGSTPLVDGLDVVVSDTQLDRFIPRLQWNHHPLQASPRAQGHIGRISEPIPEVRLRCLDNDRSVPRTPWTRWTCCSCRSHHQRSSSPQEPHDQGPCTSCEHIPQESAHAPPHIDSACDQQLGILSYCDCDSQWQKGGD